MKTIKYKTLRGFLRNNESQLDYNLFHSGMVYKGGKGWFKFSLPEEEKMKAYAILASAIYSDGERFASRLANYDGEPYGIFRRIFFTNYGGKLGATYCAGQDYVGEVRFIQKLFRQ